VDFDKLFTETNKQKFTLGGVQWQKICIIQEKIRLRAFRRGSVLESN